MEWIYFISYFFGGVFLANAVPHFVSGTMGRPFQSPFAKPPGKGLSSAMVNVLWGFLNLVVAYIKIEEPGERSVLSRCSLSSIPSIGPGDEYSSSVGIKCFDMLQKPVFFLCARIKAKQVKKGGWLWRKDHHFVQDSPDGTDEIEEPGDLLSERCLILKTFDRDVKLYCPVPACGARATNGQVLLVNQDDRAIHNVGEWGVLVLSNERKKVFKTLREWPLFSTNEKLNRIRARVEKGEKDVPILFICFKN
jgi:hypothetical protein